MAGRAKTARIFIHEPKSETVLEKVLKKRGFALKPVYTPSADIGDLSDEESDLLVVMGGPMGVYEAEDYPFLKRERQILEARLGRDLPTLGICLGSQLMASALGARVYKGDRGIEIGWRRLKILPAATMSPLHHLDSSETLVFQWHQDTFDLPEDVTLLASSDMYAHQAFSYGEKALAIQCHPEVTEEIIFDWLKSMERGGRIKADAGQMQLETQQNIGTLNRQAEKFFNVWLESAGL